MLGQLFASVALKELKANDPLDFRTPIYTQVSQPRIFIRDSGSMLKLTPMVVGDDWLYPCGFPSHSRVSLVVS